MGGRRNGLVLGLGLVFLAALLAWLARGGGDEALSGGLGACPSIPTPGIEAV